MFLKFLKRIFGGEGKPSEPKAEAAPATVSKRAAAKPLGSDIEVASLSLRVILEKLPADLHAIISQMPEPGVKIMLPLNSILKQLPTGAVRMSLASLLRQAPTGTFRKSDVEGKQMVEVPLAEIFKNVDPKRLTRRQDQRRYDVPDGDTGLFDRNGNSQPAPAPAPAQPLANAPQAATPRVMKMPELPAAAPKALGANGNGHAHSAPMANTVGPFAGKGDLVISFVELAAAWPEGVRSELSLVPGDTRLVIPSMAVGPGLQKGKVTFPWSQVRMWMSPAPGSPVAIPDELELILPLKIIAPAFVAATGATKRREAVEIDHTLPDFFGAVPHSGLKLAAPLPASTPAQTPAPHVAPEAKRASAPEPECTLAPEPAPLKFSIVSHEQAPVAEVAAPEPVALPISVAAPQQPPATTPAGLVRHACSLPGVAGAVVALEEGLVIAQSLPPGFAAETFAAFMPQIFGRLGQYTAEMQLGAATEVTIHTAHGPFHAARCGKIYFGMLGHPGERLPENLTALTSQLPSLNS